MEPDRWLGVELRHLAALQAIAEEGSFGRAARRLGYTQSAVSQQIATLERIVGERLLERPGGPRPVSLTEAGRLLLRHAEAIVARLDAARADMEALSTGAAGTLRVGTYQSVGKRLLPALLRRFRDAWPDVEIRLTESSNDEELLELVERGELDLAFVIYPLVDGPFEVRQLMRDPYVLVVPADSPLAERHRPVSVREVAELPLIGFRQCRSLVQVQSYFRGRGLELDVVFQSDDNGTVQGLVGAGVGSALVPRLTMDEHEERTVMLELEPRVPPRLIGIAWHRDRYRSPASRAFVETAAELAAELEAAANSAAAPAAA
ncbi:MAG: LysR family transcriptional regulator [Thermoleophilia bacterium]|nr:LysR family transcriptional regulator [Thermoleophilia bacterium]